MDISFLLLTVCLFLLAGPLDAEPRPSRILSTDFNPDLETLEVYEARIQAIEDSSSSPPFSPQEPHPYATYNGLRLHFRDGPVVVHQESCLGAADL